MQKKQPIYPIEPWCVTEEAFSLENNYRNETAFALSNGYIGTRGTFEEGYDFSTDMGLEGNFINGFYDSEKIRYGEWNFGFPEYSQTLLNLPNLKTTEIYFGGERFDLRAGVAAKSRRTLDMRSGIVTRDIEWVSPKGKIVHIRTTKLVSFALPHLMANRVSIEPMNFDGEIRFVSILDADVENHTRVTNPLVDYGPFGRRLEPASITAENGMLLYSGRTKVTDKTMACGSFCQISGDARLLSEEAEVFGAKTVYTANGAVTIDKFITYRDDPPEGFIKQSLEEASALGFNAIVEKQKKYFADFWQTSDVSITGDDTIQQGVRFNLFHMMQSAGRGGKAGMGAKGLSGEGYEGHYFWDTEIYVMPVFTHTAPEITKGLLDYRYHTLDAARARARELGHPKGALYPWRTINGHEASTYVPLGTAQYHINADIAYAFQQYVEVTGDEAYLRDKAAEVLFETARVWADVGCFAEGCGGKYSICCVTGPDEYTAFVDNNFYTNLMARENLRDAAAAAKKLKHSWPGVFLSLSEKIGLSAEEPELWQKIADNMYLPFDETRGVYLQDDGFLRRKPWDDRRIPLEKRHLLYENYHPLFLWRAQMAKQADAILAMLLHNEYFDTEPLSRHYDFYQSVTLHHSSLSTCIFGIAASAIGRQEEAYQYFIESARMDLDDYHNNFYAGIHAANMAGTWQAIAFGFGGLRTNGGQLEINPVLPKAWQAYSFHIQFKGNVLKIDVGKSGCAATLVSGGGLSLVICGEEKTLT